jgi:hypothetical protein
VQVISVACTLFFQDMLLLIEVADLTLKRDGSKPALKGDRTHRAEIYAKAGIGEYWIVNI